MNWQVLLTVSFSAYDGIAVCLHSSRAMCPMFNVAIISAIQCLSCAKRI